MPHVPGVGLETGQEIWPLMGGAGALVVDGEPAGVWRVRKAGKALQLTVMSWQRLMAGQRHEGKVAVTVD